jgi:hypothetical protein
VHHLKLPVSDLRRSQSWYESRLGYRLTEEFREHGDLAGIRMEHPNGGPGLASRLDSEHARRAASFDYFAIGLPDKDSNTFEVKAGVPLQRFYCHCLYCQQFMGKPYTDVTFTRAKSVMIHGERATFPQPEAAAPPVSPTGVAPASGTPTRAASRSAHPSTAAGATTADNRSSRPSRDPQGWSSFSAPTSRPRTPYHPYNGTSTTGCASRTSPTTFPSATTSPAASSPSHE